MADSVPALLDAGAAALRGGDWERARSCFAAVLEHDAAPEALFGLSDALWWLGDLAACIEHRERAYAAFRSRPDPAQAALSALLLSFDYRKQLGNRPVADGWLARAARIVEDEGVDELAGWVAFGRAFDNDDPEEGERSARRACELAKQTEDRDLELCALSALGASLVQQGRVREGVGFLDEAMAASLGGEGSPETVVVTSCNMMLSCTACAEFERALRWARATDRFTDRFGCPFLYAECRIVFGAVLVATGDWAQAEEELGAAMAATRAAIPALHCQASASLAELRLAQGRIEEAERFLTGCVDHVGVAPVRAAVQLARGNHAVAASVVRQRLEAGGIDELERSRLVEILGEAELAAGRPDTVGYLGRGLVETGRRLGCELVECRGARLVGRALAAAGDGVEATRWLAGALSTFGALGMPVEAARVRLAMAEAVADTDPRVAASEASTALESLEQVGAAGDAHRAAALLRKLGQPGSRSRPRHVGPLTEREREVLDLLGEGLSNPEIATRLYLSRKTVEHHVSRVLAKLGLRTRAEAAAEAMRRSALGGRR